MSDDVIYVTTATCRACPLHSPDASRWWDPPGELRGVNLRSWLVLELAATPGSLTVAQLVDRLGATGLVVNDRASKAISDALRWEVRRGRAVRLDRGRYSLGRLARSTHYRMRRRLAACRARARTGTPTAPLSTAPFSPHADLVGVRRDLDLHLSGPVVATTRNNANTTAATGTHAAGVPPPGPPPGSFSARDAIITTTRLTQDSRHL